MGVTFRELVRKDPKPALGSRGETRTFANDRIESPRVHNE